jgi:hypothetical protein
MLKLGIAALAIAVTLIATISTASALQAVGCYMVLNDGTQIVMHGGDSSNTACFNSNLADVCANKRPYNRGNLHYSTPQIYLDEPYELCNAPPGQGKTDQGGQSNTYNVCWSDVGCPQGQYDKIYKCGSGGNSGFNPAYVCQQLCGVPQCNVTPGAGGNGGACGYRAATVQCR